MSIEQQEELGAEDLGVEMDEQLAPSSRRDDAMANITANARRQRGQAEEQMDETDDMDEQGVIAGDESIPVDMVTIKVDGVEQQVPRSQVLEHGIRTLQKESAADKRLSEASDRIREAQSYEQRVKDLESRILSQQTSQGETLSKQDADQARAKARQVITKLMEGEEEEAADMLAEITLGRGNTATQQQPFDAGQIVSQAAAQVRQQLESQSAIKSFTSEYSEITQDPYLYRLADDETLKVQAEHPDWDLEKILLESGRRVREWSGGIRGNDPMRERADKKRNANQPIRAANARQSAAPEQTQPSRSDVVANMRKQRGLE